MSPTKRDAKHQAKALTRRRLNATERHERPPRQSQRDIEALQQALHDLGLPDDLGPEIAGRLHAPQKRLGTIVGRMFPPLFGCITTSALTRTRGWDTHLPSRMLGALPQRAWLKRLRKRGQALLVSLWRPRESMSAATRRRWPWSWGLDDAVFRPYGAPLEWVGTWWRGQHQRVGSGMDGGLLLVVIGDGKLVGPVDLAVRRPNPTGLGRRCRTTLAWAQGMRDATRAAWRRRGLELPAPLVVAESGVRDSQLMAHVANTHQGTFRVQGKNASPVSLEDGHKVQGADGVHDDHDWPWRQRLNTPDSRYARLRAKRPTSGQGTVILVDKPGAERFALWCVASQLQATRLLRLWSRRHWMAQVCRTLKHLFATDACQVHSDDADSGHLVCRLMACFVLFSTSRVIFKGHVTMDEMGFNLTHHWASVHCQALELYGLS